MEIKSDCCTQGERDLRAAATPANCIMSDLLSSHFFRTLIVFRFIVPLLYIHIKRVNSLEMCLPGREDTRLLVNPTFVDISAEDFSDIRNSFSQS